MGEVTAEDDVKRILCAEEGFLCCTNWMHFARTNAKKQSACEKHRGMSPCPCQCHQAWTAARKKAGSE